MQNQDKQTIPNPQKPLAKKQYKSLFKPKRIINRSTGNTISHTHQANKQVFSGEKVSPKGSSWTTNVVANRTKVPIALGLIDNAGSTSNMNLDSRSGFRQISDTAEATQDKQILTGKYASIESKLNNSGNAVQNKHSNDKAGEHSIPSCANDPQETISYASKDNEVSGRSVTTTVAAIGIGSPSFSEIEIDRTIKETPLCRSEALSFSREIMNRSNDTQFREFSSNTSLSNAQESQGHRKSCGDHNPVETTGYPENPNFSVRNVLIINEKNREEEQEVEKALDRGQTSGSGEEDEDEDEGKDQDGNNHDGNNHDGNNHDGNDQEGNDLEDDDNDDWFTRLDWTKYPVVFLQRQYPRNPKLSRRSYLVNQGVRQSISSLKNSTRKVCYQQERLFMVL